MSCAGCDALSQAFNRLTSCKRNIFILLSTLPINDSIELKRDKDPYSI